MSGETSLTVIGNLVADPELKFTQSGDAVAGFTVASNPRVFDRQSNEWKDGEALFLRCSAWKHIAEHAAQLHKGTRVIVQGKLKQRSFETREGQKRTVIELTVDEMGPALSQNAVQVTEGASSHPGTRVKSGSDESWATGTYDAETPF